MDPMFNKKSEMVLRKKIQELQLKGLKAKRVVDKREKEKS